MRPLNMLNGWHKVSTEYSYLILSNECFEDILRSQRFTENSWPRIEMIYALGILQSQTAQTSMFSGKNYPTTTKLNEKLQFFRERLKLSNPELCRTLMKFERLFEYRPRKVDRGLRFFEDLDVNEIKIRQTFLRTPSLLHFPTSNLLAKIHLVRKLLALEKEDASYLLSRHSGWLTSSLRACEMRIQFLRGMGMTRGEARFCVCRHPQLLSYSIDSMSRHVEFFHASGFTRAETINIIRRRVQIISIDIHRNLRPTLLYLLNNIGISHESIASTPAILSLSLSKRIIPRHMKILETAASTKKFKISHLTVNDRHFFEAFSRN